MLTRTPTIAKKSRVQCCIYGFSRARVKLGNELRPRSRDRELAAKLSCLTEISTNTVTNSTIISITINKQSVFIPILPCAYAYTHSGYMLRCVNTQHV